MSFVGCKLYANKAVFKKGEREMFILKLMFREIGREKERETLI